MPVQTSMKELTKARLQIRNTDPVKAKIYGLLVSAVKSVTIEERREECPADFANAAKKLYKETENAIAEYKKGGADTSGLEAELKEIEPFMPKVMSAEEMEKAVQQVIDSLKPEERLIKNIMPKLKSIEGMDMKAAKPLIDKLLTK